MKKRSAASSASPRPPDGLTFFLDRQLGRHKMAAILRAAGLEVLVHDDHFAQDATDQEWLAAAGENNRIVITRDERIRYRTAERQALHRAKARAFVLAAQGDLRAEALAETVLRALPKIIEIEKKKRPPFIAKVWRDGKAAVIDF